MSIGGRYYWVRNRGEEFKVKGIVVVFPWVSISEAQLKDFIGLYSSLGWNSLVCRSDYLNPFIPERATSLAFSVLNEIVKELRSGLCPIVLAAFSGGSKACMYKIFQIIEGCSEVELNLEDSRLVASCISGQIYDSDPVEFTADLGARFALHRSILKMPGSSKLVSLFAKGVTSSLDALFLTRFGSQRAEYWQTLYSSVSLGAPFLILCSENDGVAPYLTLCNFAQHLQDVGGNVKVVKWTTSAQLAVDSNQSFRRVAIGPNDHFFLPSSSEYQNSKEFGSLPEERKDRSPHWSSPCMSANSVLGQILFDACVPKYVEGWDIKFSGALNGEPYASVRRRSLFSGIKHRSRL